MSLNAERIVRGKSWNKLCTAKHFLYSILYYLLLNILFKTNCVVGVVASCLLVLHFVFYCYANEVLFFPLAERPLSFGRCISRGRFFGAIFKT